MMDKVIGIYNRVMNARYFVKLICFAALCVVCVVLSLMFSGATLAYNVEYGGEVVAQVANKEVFEAAKRQAIGDIVADNAASYLDPCDLKLTLTLSERLADSKTAADAMLGNTDKISKSAAVTVDGEQVLYAATAEELNKVLETRLAAFNTENCENKSSFVKDVKVVSVYCPRSSYSTDAELAAAVDTLSVKTVTKLTEDVVVKYSTVTKKSSEKLVGYYKVSQKGVNGINHEVEEIVYIDGVEQTRTQLEQEVVKKPVNEVVVVGTASSSGDSASGLVFPIPKSSGYYISTYFGEVDGSHVHKGVDYAVNYGTSIYAAASGTVVSAGYRSDYGYCVILNHGNGMRTLYAHCSKLLVSSGEEVTQGQTIALVGSTGWSTGNHLHFEVIVNGRYVNPATYVGK